MLTEKETIVEVKNLKKHFKLPGVLPFQKETQSVKAVDNVNFNVYTGETLGIVGESGCGKSTVARLINQLIKPTEGIVNYHGENLTTMSAKKIREKRKKIQMIFQDPLASLNPRVTVGELIAEPLIIHKVGDKISRKKRVDELMEIVGLNRRYANRYPHEFSGGQRQRINIARALVLNPELIICDEPVSALDVSVQSQVLNLLRGLQKEFNLTYVFISHDLNVVRYFCDRIAVMYLGKIVEIGTFEEIYSNPQHPYTKALFSAIPKESPLDNRERIILKGSVPSPINPPSGCAFHERCPIAIDICKVKPPNLVTLENKHQASCHRVDEKYHSKDKL